MRPERFRVDENEIEIQQYSQAGYKIQSLQHFQGPFCCSMLMMLGPNTTVHSGYLFPVCFGKGYEKTNLTWPGWVPTHKNLVVDLDVEHPI